jgi:prepilin signal peptidase PulO-like enzyme (type II secretory pathway)
VKTRKVYWHQPWIYLLILLNVLIYLVVALIVRKRASIAPGLCPRHRKRTWIGITTGWIGVFLGIFLMILSAGTDQCLWGVLGALVFLGALVAGILLSRVVLAKRIDKDFVRLKGCGQAFLDSFPEFHG